MDELHLLSTTSLTKSQISQYILRAKQLKEGEGGSNNLFLKHKTIVNLFYEPSTRTACSFHKAMLNLGGSVIHVADKYSSAEKGETLEDTIKTISLYADAIVLRHPLKGASIRAANVSSVPIINAGDGNGEHPTQALLDIFTIQTELAKYNLDIDSENRATNIVVTFTGDLKNSRTIHSLIHILCLFPKIEFQFVSPNGLEMPQILLDKLTNFKIGFTTNMRLEDALKTSDVLYVTRIQKERFTNIEEYDAAVTQVPPINGEILKRHAKREMIIMHPLPRLNEIAVEVDEDDRAVYFEQVKNGVYMRMAILEKVLV